MGYKEVNVGKEVQEAMEMEIKLLKSSTSTSSLEKSDG